MLRSKCTIGPQMVIVKNYTLAFPGRCTNSLKHKPFDFFSLKRVLNY